MKRKPAPLAGVKASTVMIAGMVIIVGVFAENMSERLLAIIWFSMVLGFQRLEAFISHYLGGE